MADPTPLDDELHWYKDAIIYELHIKAFCDGDADGIGDFQGLMQKLDYLQDLGVTAIWLLPFYPSPLKDDGYDIADYYNINPSYGDIPKFKHFLKEAHRRNLKVITELVLNHTSDIHAWFQRARQSPKGSKEREYYVWTDDPGQYKDVRIIFQDFETSNWTWDPVAGQYYWHRFFHHQPDLNYDNPLVQEEVFRIIDYWCRMGVDGFRLDAVPYLFEREGTNGENLPETHAFLKKLRSHLDKNFPGTVLLAEANMWPEDSVSYFGSGDECHMNYHFPVMPRMFMALQMEDRYPVTDIFDQTPDIPLTCQWAIFLRNHDELTLEMVTDEERDYMYKVYARDPKARINLGIRHRLAPLLDNSRRRIELLNSLLFALPGTPVIYYGDEIGMGDNFYLGDRDGVRTPMQWSPDRNAGFSAANPQKLYLPLILDPEYHYESVNVETQRNHTSSLFWFMKRLIAVRKKFKTFGRGNLKFLNVENPKVLAFTRTYEEETLLIIVNLSKFAQAAEVDLLAHKGYVPVDVFSNNRFPVIREDGLYFFTLAPHVFQWFVLEKAHPEMDENQPLPLLLIQQWDRLMEGNAGRLLENSILPRYLQKAKWFTGKEKNIYQVMIPGYVKIPLGDFPAKNAAVNGEAGTTATPVAAASAAAGAKDGVAAGTKDGAVSSEAAAATTGAAAKVSAELLPMAAAGDFPVFWLLLEVAGDTGIPGYYQLPLALIKEEAARKLAVSFPEALIASVRSSEGEGILVDAFFTTEWQLSLLHRMTAHRPSHSSLPFIEFDANARVRKHLNEVGDVTPKLHTSDVYNTSITYNNSFFLKMYRKVDRTINPDLELTRYLSAENRFEHIPAFIGQVGWRDKKGSIDLGILQEMIENHGDGYGYFLERINNYLERLLVKEKEGLPLASSANLLGTLADPLGYDLLPEEVQTLLGSAAAEQASLIGTRTAEMHKALAAGTDKDLRPEPFSLYYQRSLFSSMASLVRETYQLLARNKARLPDDLRERTDRIVAYRGELLATLRKIYVKKLDVLKIRVHGNYHLGQVLLTGRDIAISDYSGDPSLSYSERRLRRSAVVDLASMIFSFYDVAFEGFLYNRQIHEKEVQRLLPMAASWAHYMSGFFIKAYKEGVTGASLIPTRHEDFEMMLQNYLVQKSITVFNDYLQKDPPRLVIPSTVLRAVLRPQAPLEVQSVDGTGADGTGIEPAAGKGVVAKPGLVDGASQPAKPVQQKAGS